MKITNVALHNWKFVAIKSKHDTKFSHWHHW